MSNIDNKKEKRRERRGRILPLVINFLGWCGSALLYYVLFAWFFDTPIESQLRKTNIALENEYTTLKSAYDTLENVIKNIADRDNDVYHKLFGSTPYNSVSLNRTSNSKINKEYNNLNSKELADLFLSKVETMSNTISNGTKQLIVNERNIQKMGDSIKMIPSIQPVVNSDFNNIAGSFGMKIQPFVKNISFHNGIDYAVADKTRIFATASGKVVSNGQGSKGEGLTIVIDHGNGYQTIYSHLSKSLVRRNQRVNWGDIIAYSGNTGLSYLPHLHYSVSLNGEMVDPINYFFYELDPYQFQKFNNVAKNTMQSLD